MTCHGCSSKFTIFLREYTCTHCDFSFCNKCLKGKITINGKKVKVCNNCQVRYNTEKTELVDVNCSGYGLTSIKCSDKYKDLDKSTTKILERERELPYSKENMHSQDKDIYERLEKLRSKKFHSVSSDTEIKERLSVLKGEHKKCVTATTLAQKKLTAAEEVNQMLQKYADEVSLDEKLYKETERNVKDIEDRLRKLSQKGDKEENPGPSCEKSVFLCDSESESDTDTEVKKIVGKAIAVCKLGKKSNDSDTELSSDISDSATEEGSEPPWCDICNEYAVLKCFQCDGSLYCQACFKQGHRIFEMKDHQTEMLKK